MKRKKNIRPNGFEILSKYFMNSAAICSSDKIPIGKVVEYQKSDQRRMKKKKILKKKLRLRRDSNTGSPVY